MCSRSITSTDTCRMEMNKLINGRGWLQPILSVCTGHFCVRIILNDTDITQENAEPFMTSWAENYKNKH